MGSKCCFSLLLGVASRLFGILVVSLTLLATGFWVSLLTCLFHFVGIQALLLLASSMFGFLVESLTLLATGFWVSLLACLFLLVGI